MNEEMITTLFFAAVAAVIILKLRSILGQEDFNTPEHIKTKHTIIEEEADSGEITLKDVTSPLEEELKECEITGKTASALRAIAKKQHGFSIKHFTEGATVAFEMVVKAFSNGDKENLKELLREELYSQFVISIEEREKLGYTQEITILSVESAKILKANLYKDVAEITVEFMSEQINLIKDSKGKVVEGDVSKIEEHDDIWTFTKDLSSRNPNWKLKETADK